MIKWFNFDVKMVLVIINTKKSCFKLKIIQFMFLESVVLGILQGLIFLHLIEKQDKMTP